MIVTANVIFDVDDDQAQGLRIRLKKALLELMLNGKYNCKEWSVK